MMTLLALLAICALCMTYKFELEAGWAAYCYGYNSWEVWGYRALSMTMIIIAVICGYYIGAFWIDGQLIR